LLAMHARQMARLHEQVFDRSGEITAPRENRSSTLSLADLFSSSLAWWQESNPDVVRDREVARLLPRVEAFIAAAGPAFDRLARFAVIHGDLVVPNILVDDAGTPRYVDWEWAEIGDVARDLAYVGGYVSAPPWYLPLDRGQIRGLLERYLTAVGGMDDETVDTLQTRRDAWEVHERFFSSLHFRTRRGTPEDAQSGRYTAAVAQLTAGLDARLDR
jgi:aminoglycoside phosphotransferase (APT) family kinase protein